MYSEESQNKKLDNLRSFYLDSEISNKDHENGILMEELLNMEKQEFKIIKKISSGGMKDVYEALNLKTQGLVAMAVLNEKSKDTFKESFLKEARLTALLDHPNIISIHSMGLNESKQPFFTMELKKGDTLSIILKKLKEGDEIYKRKYDLNKLLEIFTKICDAVAYAHSRGILHLDIKPSNIQVGEYGEVQLCDWGLSKIISGSGVDLEVDSQEMYLSDKLNDMTLTGHIKGTPGFMAPEQINESANKTPQTDIYALGAVLYALSTYEIPVSGDIQEALEDTRSGAFYSNIKENLSLKKLSSLGSIILKTMALDPNQRYSSVEELHKDIVLFLTSYRPSAESPSFIKDCFLFYKRNRTPVLITCVFLCLLSYILSYSFISLKKSHQEVQASLKKANDALSLYQEEKEINNYNKSYLLEDVQQILDEKFYTEPDIAIKSSLMHLEQLEKSGLGDKRFASQKGIVYFISQNFDKAYEYLKTSHQGNEILFEIASSYRKKKSNNELLSTEEFLNLIDDLRAPSSERKYFISKCIIWDAQFRSDRKSKVEITKAWIKAWNHNLENLVFDYDPSLQKLKLKGDNLKSIGTYYTFNTDSNLTHIEYRSFCCLQLLPIKHLDIRDNDISHPSGISEIRNLERLDIRGLKLKGNLGSIRGHESLKNLIVDREQSSYPYIKSLPLKINIIVKD